MDNVLPSPIILRLPAQAAQLPPANQLRAASSPQHGFRLDRTNRSPLQRYLPRI